MLSLTLILTLVVLSHAQDDENLQGTGGQEPDRPQIINRRQPLDICRLKPDKGTGNESIKRYYYDAKRACCRTFIYSGYGGNKNNFENIVECLNTCYDPNICHLEQDPGRCTAIIERYYYDKYSGRCQKFIYGGCCGNKNNFKSLEECTRACPNFEPDGPPDDYEFEPDGPPDDYEFEPDGPPDEYELEPRNPLDICRLKPDKGPCRARVKRYYYDAKKGSCEIFIYGGCGGNENNFENKDDCRDTCYDPDICHLEQDSGGCYGYFQRYYYDKEKGECVQFIYGGCNGNKNNFESIDECRKACPKKSCLQKPDTGRCRAYYERYYYDPAAGTCKRFVYGGCGGNGNRHDSQGECYRKCHGTRIPPVCLLDPDRGSGYKRIPRYYFSRITGRCMRFIYRGHRGNQNNFRTLKICQNSCHSPRVRN